MAHKKFQKGDKVLITGRVPGYLQDDMRKDVPRTIVRIEYNVGLQANEYYLGTNRTDPSWEISGYPFRSYQLRAYKPGKSPGQPRTRRGYRTRKRRTASLGTMGIS